MRWYDRLYTDKLTKPEAMQIRNDIDNGNYPKKIHLITLAAKSEDLLDIREAYQLRYTCIREICPLIIGLAADRSDAMSIITDIVDACYQKTGDVRIREYLGV